MNKRTARTRQSVSVLGIVIVVVLAMACGDDGGPLAPTPQIPQVAGTYRGPITISSSTLGSVTGYAELEVVQAGSQVTITGSQTIAGNTVQLAALTGTINATGFFTPSAGGSHIDGNFEPTCGRWDVTTATRTFVGRTLQIVVSAFTTYCGVVDYSATLTR